MNKYKQKTLGRVLSISATLEQDYLNSDYNQIEKYLRFNYQYPFALHFS